MVPEWLETSLAHAVRFLSAMPRRLVNSDPRGRSTTDVKESAMFRKAMFSAVAAVSMFSVGNVEASDRFSLGLNLGGSYPVYQPAPVVVSPYPTVVAPSYGYTPNYGYNNYNYGYANPGVSFNYSNYNAYRPVRPYNTSSYNYNHRPPMHGHGHNHCW